MGMQYETINQFLKNNVMQIKAFMALYTACKLNN